MADEHIDRQKFITSADAARLYPVTGQRVKTWIEEGVLKEAIRTEAHVWLEREAVATHIKAWLAGKKEIAERQRQVLDRKMRSIRKREQAIEKGLPPAVDEA